MISPTEEQAVKALDLTGFLCPIPVVKTSQAIKKIPIGSILEVTTTDPGSKPDLVAWARMTGNELISLLEDNDESRRVFRFRIRRKS